MSLPLMFMSEYIVIELILVSCGGFVRTIWIPQNPKENSMWYICQADYSSKLLLFCQKRSLLVISDTTNATVTLFTIAIRPGPASRTRQIRDLDRFILKMT